MKLLRRRIIIRELDYHKILPRLRRLYHRVNWRPITVEEIEAMHMWQILQGQPSMLAVSNRLKQYGDQPPCNESKMLLWHVRSYLYDPDYVWRDVTVDGDWIRVRKGRPSSRNRLGWAQYELDYEV